MIRLLSLRKELERKGNGKIFGGFFCSNGGAAAVFCSVKGTATLGQAAKAKDQARGKLVDSGHKSSAEGMKRVCVEMNVSLSFTRVRAGTLANARGLRLV